MKDSVNPMAWPDKISGRFTLKHVGAVCKGGIDAGSCYLISCGAKVKDQRNRDVLQLMAGVLRAVRGPLAIAGDWNCTRMSSVKLVGLKLLEESLLPPAHLPAAIGSSTTSWWRSV